MGIVAALSGLTLSAVSKSKAQAKGAVARKEVRDLVDAIHAYKDTYGRFPVSRRAATPTFCGGIPLPPRNFTYETVGQGGRGTLVSPNGKPFISVVSQTRKLIPLDYQANNSELISILMDIEHYRTPGTPQTVNWGHTYNPQGIQFL
jgi:hypothetical protein